MKKLLKRTPAFLCVFALIFTLTACGGSKDKKDTGTDPAENSASSGTASAEDPDSEVTGKFASIQDFIDSDLFRRHLEPEITEFADKGLDMSFDAKDNKLIWNFKITDPDLSDVMDPASLESALDSQASAFEAVADTLTTAVDVDSPAVLVRYLDSKGTELASREFSVPAQEDTEAAAPDDASDNTEPSE